MTARNVILAKLTLLFSTAVVCLGQQTSSLIPKQSDPTFRSATRLVVLDVVVIDAQGNPVRNLSQEDFAILEDGTKQPIASFERPGEHAPLPTELEATRSLEINSAAPNRPTALTTSAVTVLVLDDSDTMPLDQTYARDEIRKFLQTHGPRLSEPTALMSLGETRLDLLHDYTADANAVELALDHHPAHLPFRLLTTEGTGAPQRLKHALQGLHEIAAANRQFAGRVNVIWISPGFPALNYGAVEAQDKARLTGLVRETFDLMWQGRLAIYTVNPRGVETVHENIARSVNWESGVAVAPPDSPTGDLVFERFAPQTGGRIVRDVNDLDTQVARIVDEGDAFYAMSYYPTNRNWDGKFRNIHVLVTNPALAARTRTGYFATSDTVPSTKQLDHLLSQAVMNPISFHSIEVTAHAQLSGSKKRMADITIYLDATKLYWDTPPDGKRRCEISVATAGFSSNGHVVAQSLKELEVVVDQGKYTELTRHGMVMNLAMTVPRSTVRMRVVARDSTNGNMGTADLTPEGNQFH